MNHMELLNKIHYQFQNMDLLRLACTHSSYSNEKRLGKLSNNQRLEFLGDAVLEIIVSDHIYNKFQDIPEGELTKIRAGLVCEASLSKCAREIHLGDHLMLGRGEEVTGGRNRDSILADAFEALIGAIYLDGGMPSAKDFVLQMLENDVDVVKINLDALDCKTYLQELVQKNGHDTLEYAIIDEDGPAHNKVFSAIAKSNGKILGKGKGKSKKEAEQNAAQDAINQLNI